MKMNHFNLIIGIIITMEALFLHNIGIGTRIFLGVLAALNIVIGFNLHLKWMDMAFKPKNKKEDNPFL